MIFAWFMALTVPALATLGGPWLARQLEYGTDDVYADLPRLLIHFFLATAPLLALALFSLVDSVDRRAIRVASIIASIATLGVWGWYHFGAQGVEPLTAGIILLVSPIAIGFFALALYRLTARRR